MYNIFMCKRTHKQNSMHIQYLGDWAHVYGDSGVGGTSLLFKWFLVMGN